jgi:hypothetical protein
MLVTGATCSPERYQMFQPLLPSGCPGPSYVEMLSEPRPLCSVAVALPALHPTAAKQRSSTANAGGPTFLPRHLTEQWLIIIAIEVFQKSLLHP